MRMKEGPDKLAADIFQAEFEMRMLVDGVVSAEEGTSADVETLLVGDFFRANETR
jgi:hypothetical protein